MCSRFNLTCLMFGVSLICAAGLRAQPARTAVQADTIASYDLDLTIVTATRTETPARDVASAVTVLTGEDIARKQQAAVSDLLRGTPGLDVAQNGGSGKTASVFLRGADAAHTLVLIDGIEMNDPISPDRAYNFANLTVSNVERIEVLRGPQSTLYGSDAMGGVVYITTKRGQGRPQWTLSAQGGGLGTLQGQVGISGGVARYHYAVGASWFRNRGISAASRRLGNLERDPFRNASLSGKLGLTPHRVMAFEVMFNYLDARTDIDNGGGTGQDDPNNVAENRQLFVRPQLNLTLWNGRWRQTLGYGFSDHDRVDRNAKDSAHPLDRSESAFKGSVHRVDWQNTLYLHEYATLLTGVESEQERGSSVYRSESAFGPFDSIFPKRTARMTGYYVQNQIHLRNFFSAAAGMRVDHHSRFGSRTTYRLAPVISIEQTGTRLKGTYGTGFKAPSLFQLYAPFGSPGLKPAKSAGWDAGIEQYGWSERVGVGVTYFHNRFTNLIDFGNNTFTYKNIAQSTTKGIEAYGRVEPYTHLRVQVNYTRTDARDLTTGLSLLRRPLHKWGVEASYDAGARASLYGGLTQVGKRADTDFSTFPATRIMLGRYESINLAATVRVNSTVALFGRIDNALGQSYEEVYGFGVPGFTAYGGIRVSR